MSSQMIHKKVEFTELFYDLVFVYALSKTTGLIHHLENGMISSMSLFTFLIAMLILVNTWMIQTVFTNRYGRNAVFDRLIIFVDMAILLLMANSVTTQWQSQDSRPIALAVGILSLTLFLQYLVQFYKADSKADKQLIKGFLFMLGLRVGVVFLSLFLPYQLGLWVYFGGILFTSILPMFMTKLMQVPINFPHLVERLSLLTIIALGEMIVSGVSPFWTLEGLGWDSVLNFAIVVLFFLYYFAEMEHSIDESKDTLGIRMIYLHYPILIGIILVTVSLTFLPEDETNPYFVLTLLYTGLACFYGGILGLRKYNIPQLYFNNAYLFKQGASYLLSLGISFLVLDNPFLVLVSVFALALILELQFLQLYWPYYQFKTRNLSKKTN